MQNILRTIIALVVGHPYRVIHVCPDTGKRKVFHCMSWEDALQCKATTKSSRLWIAAASGLYAVTVIDSNGYMLAKKG